MLYAAKILYGNADYWPVFERLQSEVLADKNRGLQQSHFQSSAYEQLLAQGLKIRQEALVGALYTVDFFAEDFNMCIEVNGPQHYNSRGLRANMALKYRIL